jgi:hypothetical protein
MFLRARLQASRFVFSEINKRFPTMPFTMRLIEDSGRARLGLVRPQIEHEKLPAPSGACLDRRVTSRTDSIRACVSAADGVPQPRAVAPVPGAS